MSSPPSSGFGSVFGDFHPSNHQHLAHHGHQPYPSVVVGPHGVHHGHQFNPFGSHHHHGQQQQQSSCSPLGQQPQIPLQQRWTSFWSSSAWLVFLTLSAAATFLFFLFFFFFLSWSVSLFRFLSKISYFNSWVVLITELTVKPLTFDFLSRTACRHKKGVHRENEMIGISR